MVIYDDNFVLPNGKTIGFMREDNMRWWKKEGRYSEHPSQRVNIYNRFLNNIRTNVPSFSLEKYKGKIVAEACGGPYGGIIDLAYTDEEKYQIDIFADDFKKFEWIEKNSSTTNWIASPCESIPLGEDSVDVLFAFNSLDHGWDIDASIRECTRVAKECYISFDTNRYKVPGYPDLNHYQIVDYDRVVEFLDDNFLNDKYNFKRWFWEIQVPGADNAGHTIKVLEFFIGKK